MAQGKEYTQAQKDSLIESIRPYLEMGFSRNKACGFVGLDATTLCKWAKDDEALSMKLQGWENIINTMVVKNITDAIRREGELPDDLKKENSWKWAEKRMKEDFSNRQEVTGENGAPISVVFDSAFSNQDTNTSN